MKIDKIPLSKLNRQDVFSLGMSLLEAGLLESVQSVYNLLVGKFQYDKLNILLAKFLEKYKDNQLVGHLIQMMLEPIETNRPDFLNLQVSLPSWFDVQAAFQFERGSHLMDKLVAQDRFNLTSARYTTLKPLDESFLNNTSKDEQNERKSVGRVKESQVIGQKEPHRSQSTFAKRGKRETSNQNSPNIYKNQNSSKIDPFLKTGDDLAANYYTFKNEQPTSNYIDQSHKHSAYDSNQIKENTNTTNAHAFNFSPNREDFKDQSKPNKSNVVVMKDVRTSDNEDLYEKNQISKFLKGANGNIYKSIEDSRVELNDKGEQVERIFIKYIPISENESKEAHSYLERQSHEGVTSPTKKGDMFATDAESIVISGNNNKFQNEFEAPQQSTPKTNKEPVKQTLSEFLKTYSQNNQ